MSFWYMLIRRPLSYLQTILGVGIFSYRLPRRERFPLRLIISAVLSGAVCFISARCFYLPAVERWVDSMARLSTQLVQYAAVFLTIWFCYKVTVYSALSLTSAGYCAQQIAGSIKTLIKLFPPVDALANTPLVLVLDIVCYCGTYCLLFLLFRRSIEADDGDLDNRQRSIFSLAVLLVCLINGRLTQDNMGINTLSKINESFFAALCPLLLLMIQFSVMERGRLSRNMETMQELIHEQHEQFRHSKQSVELINEKYHDLKGLLEGFHGEISRDQIDSLKERIGEYENHIETGSHVLDIVLSEKRAVCAARKIDFTSFADGNGLDFIEELDLYALVGNSLNNAIDAASRLPEEKRYLSLSLSSREGMMSLHVENPYEGELVMGEGLPESQRDRRYHGFGMKSMERICEKYGGTLAVRAENGLFMLDALLFKA
jgi:hypothetical protein